MTSSNGSTTLQIIRMLDTPRARVYAAWINPELVMQWWGMDGCVTEELIYEVWRGGRLHWLLHTKSGEKWNIRGKFRIVHPHEQIIHSWECIGSPAWENALSLVTVEFVEKEAGSRTELRLTHERLPGRETRDHCIQFWNTALDKLERLIANGKQKAYT